MEHVCSFYVRKKRRNDWFGIILHFHHACDTWYFLHILSIRHHRVQHAINYVICFWNYSVITFSTFALFALVLAWRLIDTIEITIARLYNLMQSLIFLIYEKKNNGLNEIGCWDIRSFF